MSGRRYVDARWAAVRLGIALALSVPTFAQALDVPEAPKGRVSDYAGLLSQAAIARVESRIAVHEAQSSDQIAVAIFPSLDGESLEDFSIRLAEKWKIGSAEHDNGVILLVFVEDRRSRLEVGYGLEGRLTDAMSSRILRDVMGPRFRAGDFDGGVDDAVDAVIQTIRGEYKAPPRRRQEDRLAPFLFWGFILLMVWSWWAGPRWFWTRSLRDTIEGDRTGWRRGRSPWGGWGGGSWGGGGGGFGGSGGGGFSGGGGSFGGGGASGRW